MDESGHVSLENLLDTSRKKINFTSSWSALNQSDDLHQTLQVHLADHDKDSRGSSQLV